MISRKLYAVLITIPITSLFFGYQFPLLGEEGGLTNATFYMRYVFVGMLYGVLVSIAIEKLTQKFGDARVFFSFIFHMGATIPLVIYPFLLVFGVPVAVVFFFVDELLRRKTKTSVA
ncbi:MULTISPECIES: hypothetical protein [Pontibacillus]|uniref:Uncharacterized protein n=1 Tax=Pontibacillus chungwhensis TaxID=265426 RepID=A0ABY8V0Q1_9BACI|nr:MULTISPECIES: hypothetical protein [Pontibacillus]MCD5324493.1 hypothetical protein [Pontibacillus sp. HN14]WIF99213.1 hypothetical protein QNI29_06015 [Pontibacillus chungwhensis]